MDDFNYSSADYCSMRKFSRPAYRQPTLRICLRLTLLSLVPYSGHPFLCVLQFYDKEKGAGKSVQIQLTHNDEWKRRSLHGMALSVISSISDLANGP
jgi:hypothetical protein